MDWRMSSSYSTVATCPVRELSATGIAHPRRDLPAGPHRGHEVDVQGRLPATLVVREREAAGVVDQDVDSAKLGSRRVEKPVERLRVPHVAHRPVHRNGAGAQLGLNLTQRRLTASADGDARTFLRQAERDRAADSPARTGHDRALSS